MNKKTAILSLISIAILFGLMAYGSMQMKKPPTVTEPYPTVPETIVVEDQPVTPTSSRPDITQPPAIEDEEGMVACTMEAKMCPDGTYVGRTGPRCEFAPCPGN